MISPGYVAQGIKEAVFSPGVLLQTALPRGIGEIKSSTGGFRCALSNAALTVWHGDTWCIGHAEGKIIDYLPFLWKEYTMMVLLGFKNKPSYSNKIQDDVINWKHFLQYCPFVWEFAWTKDCANSRDAGDLRRPIAHYDVIVMREIQQTHLCLNIRIRLAWRLSISVMRRKYIRVPFTKIDWLESQQG